MREIRMQELLEPQKLDVGSPGEMSTINPSQMLALSSYFDLFETSFELAHGEPDLDLAAVDGDSSREEEPLINHGS
ncbi:hypothetical protein LTR53_004110 [Teratosphaeriaceae sp. CCFEE 6253]|nr:hypothetical protein LTR53_004110 [Teratosphaeriaceae sp. CCFEE 6253]